MGSEMCIRDRLRGSKNKEAWQVKGPKNKEAWQVKGLKDRLQPSSNIHDDDIYQA